MPMGEAGRLHRGRRFTKTDLSTTGIACIHYGEIYTDYGDSARRLTSFHVDAGEIAVSATRPARRRRDRCGR